jgi:uncharacterized protein (DUF697 family)
MTRKQLPKAITRTGRDLRSAAALMVPDEEAPAALVSPRSLPVEAEHALTISALPAANDPLPGWSERAKALAVQRRALALKIVERHKVYAAAGGLVPVPIANVAAVTAVIMRMVKQLSDLYQLPFEQDRTRSAIIGLMGGAVPTGLGTAASSTLAIALPGSAFVGLAVSAVTAGALTRSIGLVFVEHYESGALLPGNVPPKHA